jgi:flagellar hook protein FlgE
MGLGTVMQTALSGMNAAAASVQVTANNLANLQTPGFKAARVRLATQAPQTLSLGAPPGAGSAGANPLQIGTGAMVAGTQVDWSQGQIVVNDQPALLALEGKGFFILEGGRGERLFTRDGRLSLNADGELVAAGGERVLGYAIDAEGRLQTGQLSPLTIRLGSQVADEGGQTATLRSFSVGRNGRITGHYSDGRNRTLGQIRIARFNNPQGFAQQAGNKLRATPASGLPIVTDPGEAGAGDIISGATEFSNVDLGEELIELTLAGNMFRANLAVLQTADALLGEMFFPWRR